MEYTCGYGMTPVARGPATPRVEGRIYIYISLYIPTTLTYNSHLTSSCYFLTPPLVYPLSTSSLYYSILS